MIQLLRTILSSFYIVERSNFTVFITKVHKFLCLLDGVGLREVWISFHNHDRTAAMDNLPIRSRTRRCFRKRSLAECGLAFSLSSFSTRNVMVFVVPPAWTAFLPGWCDAAFLPGRCDGWIRRMRGSLLPTRRRKLMGRNMTSGRSGQSRGSPDAAAAAAGCRRLSRTLGR
jgi:hypothetical protein